MVQIFSRLRIRLFLMTFHAELHTRFDPINKVIFTFAAMRIMAATAIELFIRLRRVRRPGQRVPGNDVLGFAHVDMATDAELIDLENHLSRLIAGMRIMADHAQVNGDRAVHKWRRVLAFMAVHAKTFIN